MIFKEPVFKNALGWFFLFLLAGELTAWAVYPFRDEPRSVDVFRNPRMDNGWPEYLKGEGAPEKKRVILISNSQGLGEEIRDPGKIYAALLQEAFSREGAPVQIENWSSPGARTVDLELLSMKAAQNKASLVVFVLGYKNIDGPREVNLNFPRGDIHLLAGDPALWPFFSDSLFFANGAWEDVLARTLALHSWLVRLRFSFYGFWSYRLPDAVRGFFREGNAPHREFEDLRDIPEDWRPRKADYLLEKRPSEHAFIIDQPMGQRLQTFRRFYAKLQKRLDRAGVNILWVWCPTAADAYQSEDLAKIRAFNRRCSQIIEDTGVPAVDFTEKIPSERFFTRAHLDEEGHRMMRDLLLPEMRRAVQ